MASVKSKRIPAQIQALQDPWVMKALAVLLSPTPEVQDRAIAGLRALTEGGAA